MSDEPRYVCIHGHFYQPPRENAWLGTVEVQDSAYPYHDWNERVTDECYRPNARSRILDPEGRIVEIVDNYERMSFDFGPTLLSWLEHEEPDVYEAVLEADRRSVARYGGHGSALAQPFHHTILPLAHPRDKRTEVLWGLADFRRRFGREPEGAWLPETAVDVESLELLAAEGVRFTLLEPRQAQRFRKLGAKDWKDVGEGGIDPSRAYVQNLPSGRSIALFFYDGPISRAVAFEGLLTSGERFAGRIATGFSDRRGRPQLVHIATDGETYGHHHRFGDMALAFAFRHLEEQAIARLTNYGEFLERHPPTHEVEVRERTSWSCAHGVARWHAHCGCHTGGKPGWTQHWREPLRAAFDWLRDELAPRWEEAAKRHFARPWEARDAYVEVVLDRSPQSVAAFLERHAGRPLGDEERVEALELMELQRHALLMYTSCGWFFNELSGIETVQVLQYAGRAVELAGRRLGGELEPAFLERLAQARSNVAEQGDGRRIFERYVAPSRVGLLEAGAHFAVSSLFEKYPEEVDLYAWNFRREDLQARRSGRARIVLGRVRVTSRVTYESERLAFGAVHFGDHNLNGGVRPFRGRKSYDELAEKVLDAFVRADLGNVVRLLDRHFEELVYHLRSLFRDEQRRVLERVVGSALEDAERRLREVYEHQAPLMRYLGELGTPLPTVLRAAAQFVVGRDLRREFEGGMPDGAEVRRILEETATWGLVLDTPGLAYTAAQALAALLAQFATEPDDLDLLHQARSAVEVVSELPFEVDLFHPQNTFYELLQGELPAVARRAEEGDPRAAEWVREFRALGTGLRVRVD